MGLDDGQDILTLSIGGTDGWTEGTASVVASRIAAFRASYEHLTHTLSVLTESSEERTQDSARTHFFFPVQNESKKEEHIIRAWEHIVWTYPSHSKERPFANFGLVSFLYMIYYFLFRIS